MTDALRDTADNLREMLALALVGLAMLVLPDRRHQTTAALGRALSDL